MPDPFVHLHVASGYSLHYGASHPHALVERAAEQEMDTLALTDRDGTYGAVKFARACHAAGIRPVLGVDLAYRPVLAARRGAGRATDAGPRCAAAPSATPVGGRAAPGDVPGHRRQPGAAGPAGRRCAGWSRRTTWPASAACRSSTSTTLPPTEWRERLGGRTT